MKFIPVSQIVESNGLTVKENNLAIKHSLPIGALVELIPNDTEFSHLIGIRLRVVKHNGDCDGTPLYGLGIDSNHSIVSGISETWLRFLMT